MKRPLPNLLAMASLLVAGLQDLAAHEPSDHLGLAGVGAGPVPQAAHHDRSLRHYPLSPAMSSFTWALIANYLVLYLVVAL
jgi:hypothetical protein